ncbi:hypothetical protein BGZ52_010577 [Haplosporangium bisporale]|nr:hypothetical protein BGZ52_010577 [Haplosporangium bisporale]KAF9200883.1 hypothetical protein BGZ59_003040 [Podila verticillata]
MNPKPKPKPKPLNISAEFNHQAFVTIKKTLKVTLGQNVEPAREMPVAKKTSVKEVYQERRAKKLRRERIGENSEETSWSSDSNLDDDPRRKEERRYVCA